eukprot:1001704-Prymnesium_polylepis.2
MIPGSVGLSCELCEVKADFSRAADASDDQTVTRHPHLEKPSASLTEIHTAPTLRTTQKRDPHAAHHTSKQSSEGLGFLSHSERPLEALFAAHGRTQTGQDLHGRDGRRRKRQLCRAER